MPTIAELLSSYRDRTGDSYEDMARKVGDEISRSRMHQLTVRPPREFPKLPRTVEALADMLQVPVTTIVLAFAAGLGLPVTQSGSTLEVSLPPGTDSLEADDIAAIRAVIRQLIAARTATAVPAPDLDQVQGLRLAEEKTGDQAPVVNGTRDGRQPGGS